MAGATVTFDEDVLDAVRGAIKKAPRAIDAFIGGTVREHLEKQYIARFPTPPARPKGRRRALRDRIRWTSERQRRAFFATDGFGRGIPYRHTGKLVKALEVQYKRNNKGISLTVVNESPAAPFVIGAWQQGFHADWGWPQLGSATLEKQMRKVYDEAQNMVIDGWFSIVDLPPGAKLA